MTHSTFCFSCTSILFTLGLCLNPSQAAVVVDFEDQPLSPGSADPANSTDQSPLVSRGVRFTRDWSTEFDCCPSGWARSNQTDLVTPGSASAFSAYVTPNGGGFNSDHFAVANNFQRGEARVAFPEPAEVQGMFVTNVTYTYLATVNGDDGAGFVKGPFESGDWLRLDVIGLDPQQQETGRVPIYLVDYRSGNEESLDDWTWFDLSSLGSAVASLEFEMNSTDIGPFGMNTPAYFAIDDLTFRVVPEPNGLACALVTLVGLLSRCRMTRSQQNGV